MDPIKIYISSAQLRLRWKNIRRYTSCNAGWSGRDREREIERERERERESEKRREREREGVMLISF
jgi:hypothetical protein